MRNNIIEKYTQRLLAYIEGIHTDAIIVVRDMLKNAIYRGHNIYVIGNGGSIATAMHFVEDVLFNNTLPTHIYHLSNISAITAISNDVSYDDCFVEQLKYIFNDNDVLIAISCSGNSQNLVKAVEFANTKGFTISITGFNGGIISKKATESIHIPTKVGDYEATEDIHMIICHMIACLIKEGHETVNH